MGLPFETNEGIHSGKSLGLVILSSDETTEPEFAGLFGAHQVGLYHARIPSSPEATPETLKAMERDLPATLALLPATRRLDVVAYACTSASTLIGAERVARMIAKAHPQAGASDPITAVLAACRAMGVSRIGFLTPYIPSVSEVMRSYLQSQGIEVVSFGSFEQASESTVARIDPGSTLAAIEQLGAEPRVEALFASCTNLQTFGIIEEAERRLGGRPVISSNLALAWHMTRLANLPKGEVIGPGSLWRY